MKNQLITIWGFPCMFLVAFNIFFLKKLWSIWLLCVLISFYLGLYCVGSLCFLDLSVCFPMLGKISAISSSSVSSGSLSLSLLLLGGPYNANVGTFNIVPAAAKSIQSYLTVCDPTDGSSRGSPIPGILQVRTLEWVAISFSNAWKWKVKVKSRSCVRLFSTPWTTAHQALCPWDFPGKSTGVGCHCLSSFLFILSFFCSTAVISTYLSSSSLILSSASFSCHWLLLVYFFISVIILFIYLFFNTSSSLVNIYSIFFVSPFWDLGSPLLSFL